MSDAELDELIGKNVIVSDLWGFGFKFYQAKVVGTERKHYSSRIERHLVVKWYEKYAPIIHKTFELRPGKRNVYKPT